MAITKTNREIQSEQVKNNILIAAKRLFKLYSFDKVSMRELAEAAGVTTGALYHHFGNKDEILKAVFWDHLTPASLMIDFASSANPAEDLENFFCKTLPERVLEEGPDLTYYRFTHIIKFDHVSRLNECTQVLTGLLVQNGIFDDNFTPEEIADIICSVYRQTIFQYARTPENIDLLVLMKKRYDVLFRAFKKVH